MDTRTGQISEYASTDKIPPNHVTLTRAQCDELMQIPMSERTARAREIGIDVDADAVIIDPSMTLDSESLSDRIDKFQGVGVGPFRRLKEPPVDYSDYKPLNEQKRTFGCGSRCPSIKDRFKKRKK